MDDLLGAIAVGAFLLACWLIYQAAINSWPVCGLLVIAVAVLFVLRKSENPWAKAVSSTARASAIGFGILTACLLVFNLALSSRATPETVSATETALIRLSAWLPGWAEPTVWQLALVLAGLVVVNRVWPSSTVVSRFLTAKKIASRVTAGLTVAASFSFFGSQDVLGRAVRQPIQKLTVRYVGLQKDGIRQLERYLIARAKAETVRTMPVMQQRSVASTSLALARIEGLSDEARLDVARSIGDRYMRAPGTVDDNRESLVAPEPPLSLLTDPDATYADQRGRIDAAERLAAEAERAYEEILSETISEGTGAGVTLARAIFDAVFDVLPVPLSSELPSLLEKVADEYVSQRFEPLVKKYAAVLAGRMRWTPPPDRPGERAGLNTVRSVIRAQLESARSLARQARLPGRDVESFPKASDTGGLVGGLRKRDMIVRDWQLRSLQTVQPPAGVSEEAYTDAKANANRASALLSTYARAAAPLGLADVKAATESDLRSARTVLNRYEPIFTAIAQQREAQRRVEMERARESFERRRELERIRIEARPRAIP